MRYVISLGLVLMTALSLSGSFVVMGQGTASPAKSPSVPTKPSTPSAGTTDSRFFLLKDVKPGLKGIGRTIFQGDRVEEFGVEILGVLPGTPAPTQSLIIVRLTGANAERTGIFAGMSGSPVFVDGRLLGAVSYSFPFSKEPIGAVTPIEQMVSVFEEGVAEDHPRHGLYSFRDLVTGKPANVSPDEEWRRLPVSVGMGAAFTPEMASLVGQTLLPISTPLAVSGVPSSVLMSMAPQFEPLGFHLVAGTSGSSPILPMKPFDQETMTPGRTIAVQLARGDFGFNAAGTVTWRDGDRIFAFGHPFFPPGGIGGAQMPMSEASVITVVPNLNNSFKLVIPDAPVGTISQDRSTGIRGRLGEVSPMIPVTLNVTTSRGIARTYHFEVVQDVFLTPILVNLGVVGSLTATERSLGDLTLQMQGKIQVEGQPVIELANSFTSRFNPANSIGTAIAQPLGVLLGSGFDNVKLQGITLDVTASDSRSNGTLDRLWTDRTEVHRGEKIELQAFARNANGQTFVERIPVEIPMDARTGLSVISVSDGAALALSERRAGLTIPDPKDVGQLVRVINRLRKNNRLYVKIIRAENGAVINNEEMPSLPPSMLTMLGSNRTAGGYQPLAVSTLYERELPPPQFLITGQQTLTIEIVK